MAPRVAIVSRSYFPDDQRVLRQAWSLVDAGARVHVIALRRPGCEEPASAVHEGVAVTRLGGTRARAGRLRYLLEYGSFFASAAAALAREHAREPFALVQVANPPDALLGCAASLRLTGTVLVLDIHDLSPELYASKFGGDGWPLGARVMALMERAATAAADHVLVAGDDFREVLVGRGVAPERVTSVPNGPDERLFHGAVAPVDDRPGRLVYHGSLFDRYDVGLVLDALPRIHARHPGAMVDIWGDGPELESLRARARTARHGAVRVHGRVPLAAIPGLVAGAACGVSTLRSDRFTELAFPTKVWEYAQLGVPVAASRTRALMRALPADALRSFAPGDAEGLAAAVVGILDDPAAAAAQAARARAATERFAWSRHGPRYASLVLALARDGAVSRRRSGAARRGPCARGSSGRPTATSP
jgi:glycosyltransferase involved in cell wall biosynthesis